MTGPSDSGVQVEAEACREEFIKTGMWPNEVMYQSWCKAWKASAAWNRRAALPVAPSDERATFDAAYEQHLRDTMPPLNAAGQMLWHFQAGWQAFRRALPVAALSDVEIRSVFMAHGFTIKEGQTDLKPYVYEAARALLRHSEGKAG